MRRPPHVVDAGSVIRVLHHPKSARAALELDLDSARIFIRDMEAVLATHDRLHIQRETALLVSLRRMTAERCEAFGGRDRAPYEISRREWQSITEPLRWLLAKGDTSPVPPALVELLRLLLGNERIKQALQTQIARAVRLVGTRHSMPGEVEVRHDRYVAHALVAGLEVPRHVLRDYGPEYWRASDCPWVEYFLSPTGWATSLLGRLATEHEARALASGQRGRDGLTMEAHLSSLHRLTAGALEARLPEKRAAA